MINQFYTNLQKYIFFAILLLSLFGFVHILIYINGIKKAYEGEPPYAW